MTDLIIHGMSSIRGRCTAHSRSGNPCKRTAIAGGSVCHWHGGAIPAVRSRAAERLLAAVDPAVTELLRIMRHGDSDVVRLRAVEAILDRAGHPRGMLIGGMTEAEARASLVAALVGLRERREGCDDGP